MFSRLCVRRRLQQHLRLRQDPQQRTESAVLRVCGQWGTRTTVWEGWRLVGSLRKLKLTFAVSPPVLCRNVWPEIGPAPAGEHCEESGSVRPAGDEPAAHKAPVLPGPKLPQHPVKTTFVKCTVDEFIMFDRWMIRCLNFNYTVAVDGFQMMA